MSGHDGGTYGRAREHQREDDSDQAEREHGARAAVVVGALSSEPGHGTPCGASSTAAMGMSRSTASSEASDASWASYTTAADMWAYLLMALLMS